MPDPVILGIIVVGSLSAGFGVVRYVSTKAGSGSLDDRVDRACLKLEQTDIYIESWKDVISKVKIGDAEREAALTAIKEAEDTLTGARNLVEEWKDGRRNPQPADASRERRFARRLEKVADDLVNSTRRKYTRMSGKLQTQERQEIARRFRFPSNANPTSATVAS